MQRVVVVAIGLAVLAGAAAAQERIPAEEAQRIAQLLTAAAAKETDLPVTTAVDAAKPFGLKKDDAGAMVLPDQKLSAEALQKGGKEPIPVGHLWVRKLTVVVKDQPVANDRLRILTVTAGNEDHALPLFLLAAHKTAAGGLELVLHGKAKEPLLRVPLEAADRQQEMPLELEGRGENGRGVLTLFLLGKYRAEVPMAKQE
jgi:hypothetical protein